MIVLGAIAPHGDPAFREGSPTREALEELGRRLDQAQPDVTIVATPHNVHVEGSFAVVTAATIAGSLAEQELDFSEQGVELKCTVDRGLADAVVRSLQEHELPTVGMSFGSNDPALAEMPMDWGTLIPLWFLGREERPVVVVSPCRERSVEDHVVAGRAIAAVTDGKRAAFVASADHGHAHDPEGPFGFDPASAEYDERVVELVSENRLGHLSSLESIATPASADSLWQMVMLHGALGHGFCAELLAYERPTYFGMLVAAFEPA
jgi:aromatic ring-opening dioxygenase LigB subunit